MEQVEQKVKDMGTTHVDAISELFRDKGERPELEYIDFEEMNVAIWAALAHKIQAKLVKR